MNTTNNILLAKWADGDATQQDIDLISEMYDLHSMATDLDKLDEIKFRSRKVEDAWLDFEQKLLVKKQKPSLVLR